VLARIGRALEKIEPKILPQSLPGKAIHYARGLRTELNQYVQFGERASDHQPRYSAAKMPQNEGWLRKPLIKMERAKGFEISGTCQPIHIKTVAFPHDY